MTPTESSAFETNRLKIVHTLSSLEVGGMEHVVLRLAAVQQAAGHEVSILAARGGPLTHLALQQSLRADVLGAGRSWRTLSALRRFYSCQPDIVHAHNLASLPYAVLGKLVSHAAVLVTLHGDKETQARAGTTFEWRLTSTAVTVSRAAAGTFDLPSFVATAVVHNGVEASAPVSVEERSRLREELGVHPSFVGVMVARIDGRKGHRTLLKSLALLRDIPVTVLIVGDGAERAAVEAHAHELGLDGRAVQFLGTRSDVPRILAAADCFVLPSDAEGLPMSVLEAMAAGLPIIATRVGGVPELVEDGTHGLLVPPGDPNAIAAAIRRVRSDEAARQRFGREARRRVEQEFTLQASAEKYVRLYRQALAQG